VRQFFRGIPEDSLPYFDAEVQLSQLVLIPEPTAEQRAYARERAEEIRQRVLDGEELGFLAGIYSDDPGSKEQQGDLGCVGRGQFVPEFEAAASRTGRSPRWWKRNSASTSSRWWSAAGSKPACATSW
jgi:peptidyl-prolyl cis-trans isomerase SurA